MKHIAQRGAPDFRQALARQSAAVRDLTHFRCAPDPFKGDIPWKRVQEYARDTMEALHAAPVAAGAAPSSPSLGVSSLLGVASGFSAKTEMPPLQAAYIPTIRDSLCITDSVCCIQGRIQGFGSDVGGSSGMMGFGSDSQGSGGGGRVPMRGFGSGSGGLTAAPESMLDSFSSGMKDLTDRAMGAMSRPQHRLMHSGDSNDGGFGFGGGGGGESYSYAPARVVHEPAAPPRAPQAAASSEQRIVDRICTPKGLKVAPGSEDLAAFVEAAAAADGMDLAAALQKKLVSSFSSSINIYSIPLDTRSDACTT